MTYDEAKKIYNELFNTLESKAKAFDTIAEKYYFSNFGSISRSDFDTLMFSLYIEQILFKHQDDFSAYSDYTLSKQLGITQTKVSNLKVKKELLYPFEGFNWQKAFERISSKAIYEGGKIKLFVPDKNLYLEIKNAIETAGGFIEVQLTPNLLQVRLPYFLDLLIAIDSSKDREELRKQLKNIIELENTDIKVMDKEPIGKALLKKTPDLIIDLIGECIPIFGGIVKSIGQNLLDVSRQGE